MMMDTNDVKVSIITPVYNGEQFIDKCFGCVKAQTYNNIEWIVINDGSQDNSLSKLESIRHEFSNLTIIDQKNSGAAEARRAGALKAAGDYIAYLDIDDVISDDAIKLAMEKFTEIVDLVLFTQIKLLGSQSVPFNMFSDIWPQAGTEVFKACIDGWGAHSQGIYRKAIFLAAYHHIDNFHNVSKTYKDELLTRIIFSRCRSVEYCNGKYYYNLNDASVSKKFNPQYFMIANNVHALSKYLATENINISLERMYSRLFFDIFGRYIKWRKQLSNTDEWQDTLIKLVKYISVTEDFKNTVSKTEYKKIIPRALLLITYKIVSKVRKA